MICTLTIPSSFVFVSYVYCTSTESTLHKVWEVVWGVRERYLIIWTREGRGPSRIAPCTTDGGRGVQKFEKTFYSHSVQNFRQLPSCFLLEPIRNLEQKHQFEGSDFVHPAQCLKHRDLRGQVRHLVIHEDDNELGEHTGCDSREYPHDEMITGVCPVETACPVPDF